MLMSCTSQHCCNYPRVLEIPAAFLRIFYWPCVYMATEQGWNVLEQIVIWQL